MLQVRRITLQNSNQNRILQCFNFFMFWSNQKKTGNFQITKPLPFFICNRNRNQYFLHLTYLIQFSELTRAKSPLLYWMDDNYWKILDVDPSHWRLHKSPYCSIVWQILVWQYPLMHLSHYRINLLSIQLRKFEC